MPMSQSPGSRSYTPEQVQQILNLAITQQDNPDELSWQQLVEIATELGISTAALAAAERSWNHQEGQLQQYQAFNRYRQANLRRQVGQYAIVNSGLLLLNLLTGGSLWCLYVLLFWGLKLGLDTWNVYHTQGEAYEKAFRKWNRQHQFQTLIQTWLGRLLNA